jgi:hypothetical protein
MTKMVLLFPILFLLFANKVNAVTTLTSTQVGTTAVLTSTVPPNACTVYKMGESRPETVTGFYVSSFSMNDKGTIIGNWAFVDLSESSVRQLTISGKTITNFKESARDLGVKNRADVIKKQRNFDFDSPILFNPADTATLTLGNVKIAQAGKVQLGFGFYYNNGVNPPCISSGWSTFQIGSSSNSNSASTSKATVIPVSPHPTSSSDSSFGESTVTPIPTLQPTISPSSNLILRIFSDLKLNLQYLFDQLLIRLN